MNKICSSFKMLIPFFVVTLICSVSAQSGHPEFELEMEQVVLQEGALEKVECIAKGELPLTYTWYGKSDQEISPDANEEIFTRTTERGSSLIFTEVKISHAGLYTCSATNKHGTASKSYDILVNGTSGNITTNETAEIVSVKVINITENSVEFDVQTTGNPEFFYIRYQEKVAKNESSVEIKRGDSVVVKGLVPAGRYQFWFQIEPPSRVKIPSTPYEVVMLADAPDVIFRNVQSGVVDLEWFRSIDDFSRSTIKEYELSYNTIQQYEGRYWKPNNCVITIKIPNCGSARYMIAGLQSRVYYEIRLRILTESGYGKPYINKVYML